MDPFTAGVEADDHYGQNLANRNVQTMSHVSRRNRARATKDLYDDRNGTLYRLKAKLVVREAAKLGIKVKATVEHTKTIDGSACHLSYKVVD
jgi:hypothetical protein